jgi:hypothetical protein
MLAPLLASCSDSKAQTGVGEPAPEPLPLQVQLAVSGLPGFKNVDLAFDQPVVMSSFLANTVQVTNTTFGTSGGASFTASTVSAFATGEGVIDMIVLAVIQADDVISGTASIGGGSVTLAINESTHTIANGPFSFPIGE